MDSKDYYTIVCSIQSSRGAETTESTTNMSTLKVIPITPGRDSGMLILDGFLFQIHLVLRQSKIRLIYQIWIMIRLFGFRQSMKLNILLHWWLL